MTASLITPTHNFGTRDPDARGYFGAFGGRFVPETLVSAVEALTDAYFEARRDPAFRADLEAWVRRFGHTLLAFEEGPISRATVLKK